MGGTAGLARTNSEAMFSDELLLIDAFVFADQQRLTSALSGLWYSIDDLPRRTFPRDGWRKRIKELLVPIVIRWWWWLLFYKDGFSIKITHEGWYDIKKESKQNRSIWAIDRALLFGLLCFGLVLLVCFTAYQPFSGHLMPD